MKMKDVMMQLESRAPLRFQEEYDNSGLISGDPMADCSGILVSLDCTEQTVQEAVEKNCNLIVSHHPLIFRPIRRLTGENEQGRALLLAIRKNITLYAIHTNLDNMQDGVNGAIADKIGLTDRKILLCRTGEPQIGSGLIGRLSTPLSETALLGHLQTGFRVPVVRHSPLTGKTVSLVALCGGAGSFLISNALEAGAQFFITADVKYHEFFGGEGRMVIADIGHFESEQYTIDLLHAVILEKYPNFAVLKSGTVTNPVNYYI